MTKKTEVATVPVPSILMGRRGVELATLEDTFRFAKCVFDAGMGTKGDSIQTITIKIQMGAECGLPPMASIQNIAVINGRPSIWGDAMLGVCRAAGIFDEAVFDETVDKAVDGTLTATCTVRRLPFGLPINREFSMKDATVAGLAGKAGPWQQYPRRMLQLRARSWALRDGFADVLRGLRSTEEERDIVEAEPAEPVTSLEDLTEKLTKPDLPSGKEFVTGGEAREAALLERARKIGSESVAAQQQMLLDAAADPPSTGEVLADQHRLCDEYATLFGEAAPSRTSATDVKAWTEAIVGHVADNKLTEEQAGGLYELANAAKDRLSKVV